ncbi:MAG: TasA family protein, partial [Candidatus Nanohaloarchaea archaeon]
MNKSLLISFTVISISLALAGGVTYSLFTDTEQSLENTFASGSLDLKIDYNESYNNKSQEKVSLTDDPGAIFSLSDVKPGDTGEATVSFHLFDNPGWIWMQLNRTAEQENNCTEPETELDSTCGDPGEGEGELFQEINFTAWYDD